MQACPEDADSAHPHALQAPSNVPYAHWSWRFLNATVVADNNCVAAFASDTYDHWNGNASISNEQSNSSYYQTANTQDNKYGWWVPVLSFCRFVLPGVHHRVDTDDPS